MKKTVQDVKVKTESLKKTQTKERLEMKGLESQTKPSEINLTHRVQEVEDSLRPPKQGKRNGYLGQRKH